MTTMHDPHASTCSQAPPAPRLQGPALAAHTPRCPMLAIDVGAGADGGRQQTAEPYYLALTPYAFAPADKSLLGGPL